MDNGLLLILIILLIILIILSIIIINILIMKNKSLKKKIIPQVLQMRSPTKERRYYNSEIDIYPHSKPSYNVAMNGDFQQVGNLSSLDKINKPIILPLFGRRLNRHRWEYYTATEHNNQLRINMSYKNRDCEDEYGCDEIENGDTVDVPTYSKSFTANIYRYRPIRYVV